MGLHSPLTISAAVENCWVNRNYTLVHKKHAYENSTGSHTRMYSTAVLNINKCIENKTKKHILNSTLWYKHHIIFTSTNQASQQSSLAWLVTHICSGNTAWYAYTYLNFIIHKWAITSLTFSTDIDILGLILIILTTETILRRLRLLNVQISLRSMAPISLSYEKSNAMCQNG